MGSAIAEQLRQHQHTLQFARADEQKGLTLDGQVLTGTLEALIICFVPHHRERGAGWFDALTGLHEQVQRGELQIKQCLFISSTSVYESVEFGLVDRHTTIEPISIRSGGLLHAESIIAQLSDNTSIFRCTGLVGPGYHKYDPVPYSVDKPRQAVDIRAVAVAVAERVQQAKNGHHIEVLTNGKLYWQQQIIDQQNEPQRVAALSESFRLLQPSLICPDPVSA